MIVYVECWVYPIAELMIDLEKDSQPLPNLLSDSSPDYRFIDHLEDAGQESTVAIPATTHFQEEKTTDTTVLEPVDTHDLEYRTIGRIRSSTQVFALFRESRDNSKTGIQLPTGPTPIPSGL
ncbi:hypothetical protein FKW77_001428 [Venturia effusa]|uniref:Uncharacterized protein n=1 Tax=Venturia effusa TaxID=50376 RepID=A0A517LAD8_9PEZI|nr:hypothetical protein FKW77_001428 [Venturia effusa]